MLKPVGDPTVVFQGRRVTVERHPVSNEHTLFNYEVVRVKNAVAVLPILRENGEDHLILLRHHRYPIDELHSGDTILEACAGVIEDYEASYKPGFRGEGGVLSAAKREMKEETGYTSEDWEFLGYFYPSPGILTERIFLYIARDIVPGLQELEDSEKGNIEVIKMPLSEAVNLLLSARVEDLKTATLISQYVLRNISRSLGQL